MAGVNHVEVKEEAWSWFKSPAAGLCNDGGGEGSGAPMGAAVVIVVGSSVVMVVVQAWA